MLRTRPIHRLPDRIVMCSDSVICVTRNWSFALGTLSPDRMRIGQLGTKLYEVESAIARHDSNFLLRSAQWGNCSRWTLGGSRTVIAMLGGRETDVKD